ncbi:MAG: biotin/lipoyl-containing protein [Myxococcota bacterium]
MNTPVVVPMDLWDEEEAEGVVTAWMFDDGASVSKGAIVVEIMEGKTQHEIVAPADGILRIVAKADEIITKGATLGTIEAPS